MVLGHECVFCRGGPEQRAVHKGCGMERQRRLDRRRHRRDDGSRKTAKKTASDTSPGCSLCLKNGCKTNVKNVCSYKEINNARNAGRNMLNLPTVEKNGFLARVLSRKDARVDFYGSNLRGTRSFSTTNSAHTTPTAQHCGKKKREVVRRCCSPDLT